MSTDRPEVSGPAMPASPRVSIGLPVYNGEAYLGETLDTLLAQTFTDFELIVSDNRSDDDTERLCREYAARDPRVRYIRNQRNRGAAWNHNKVISEARGELFKLACYDDLCAPDMVEACVHALDQHPEAVLARPKTMMMDGDMSRLKEYTTDLDLSAPRTALRFGDLIHEAPPSFPLFGVIRMQALRQVPPFGSYKASDRVVLARLALLGPFVNAPDALFYYRWHDGNASRLMSEPARFYHWWDTASRDSRVFPETRLLREYIRSLWLIPLSMQVRRECAREIRLWYRIQKPMIKWEIKQLIPGRSGVAPPRTDYFEKMARRAHRQQLKRTLYPENTQ